MSAQPLTPDLLASVAALEKEAFPHPWSERSLALLCGPTAFGFACLEGERVVAYGGMLTVLNEGQITNIATHPAYRRRGLGGQVMKALLAEARARRLAFVTLEVRESNFPAIALYEAHGFRKVGYRPHFYTDPEEAALLLQCDL